MSFGLTPLDAAALAWFLFWWVGYTVWADYIRHEKSLVGATALYRRAWMAQMLVRENRIVDTTLVGTLSRSSSFFAQTSIFILAGLIAVVGAQDVARVVVADLPFAQGTSAELWEIKLGLEIVSPERRSPEYLAKFLPQEVERWGRVIRAAGISAD